MSCPPRPLPSPRSADLARVPPIFATRLGRSLALACLSASLLACGGGSSAGASDPAGSDERSNNAGDGSGDGNGNGNGNESTVNPPSSSSGIFAEPSRLLCTSPTEPCSEPTASFISAEQLIALQRNPNGSRVRFRAIGVEFDDYYESVHPHGVTRSVTRYAAIDKPIVLGADRIVEDETTYVYASTPDAASFRYVQGESQAVLMAMLGHFSPFVLERALVYDRAGSATSEFRRGVRQAFATLGPLTDKASAPKESTITYSGMLYVQAGDGSPITLPTGIGVLSHKVFGSCPVDLTLDVASGRLTTTPVTCKALGTDAEIRFSLSELDFRDSRISDGVATIDRQASISISGPSSGNQNFEPTSVVFETSTLNGAVYGPAAAGVAIHGQGSKGIFHLQAWRQ